MSEPGVNPAAEVFGDVVDEYERGRPGYPAPAVDFLFGAGGLGAESRLLEVGAGSGKLTRDLVGRVGRVVAVEPSDGMRATLSRSLPDVEVRAGTAEALPMTDAELDAVVAAQAFHWFDAPVALAEFHRVLRPNGALVLIWNVRDQSTEINSAVTGVIDRYYGDVPSHYRTDWSDVVEATGLFSETVEASFPNSQHLDEAAFLSRFMSVSWVASQAAPQHLLISEQLTALHGQYAEDGIVTVDHDTNVYVSRRNRRPQQP
jgi:SAM-dependent methyltransferase